MYITSKQYNIELLKLMQRFATDQQLFNLSKCLESRAQNLACENLSFREAKASLTVKTIRDLLN